MASKSCALSLVRQLYHLGVIEKFEGTLKKDRSKENEIAPYKVAVDPVLISKVNNVLDVMKIPPTHIPDSTEVGELW